MQLLILASVLTVGLCLPGGYTNQDLSDPAVKQSYLDKLVLLKSKNLIFASENSLPQLTLLNVKSQVVSGMNYIYTVQIGDKVCSIQFYEQSWTGTYEIKSDECKVQKRQLAGGYTTQNKDDPKYAEILAKLSSDGKIQLPANANSYDLVSVQTQVVAGINYKFTLQMHGQTCEIVYYEASWMNKYEITSDSCSQLTHSKRGLAGGWSPVTDTSDAGVQACLGASLDKLNSMANSMYRMVDKSIDSIDQQVVAGMKYRYTVQVAPSTCIKSQANMGFTSVSCPVDTNHIMQSQTWSGSCVYAPWQTPKTQLLEFHMAKENNSLLQSTGNTENSKGPENSGNALMSSFASASLIGVVQALLLVVL